MINAILNGLLNFVTAVVSVLTAPFDAMLDFLFPNIAEIMNSVASFLSSSVFTFVGYFIYILPSPVVTMIQFYLLILIGLYGTFYTYNALTTIFRLIRNIKFW